MQKTFKLNHPETEVMGDVCNADYSAIEQKYGKIDVVIGGPPCQGFSNANRQRNHAINQNNMLVKQYIRAILELKPKAFIMENVSMLRSDVHRFYLDENDREVVEKYNIPLKETELELLGKDYFFREAPQIVRDKTAVEKYLWPEDHYKVLNVIYKATKNPKKLVHALTQHRKELLLCAEAHRYEGADYILKVDADAFQGIEDFYDGLTSAGGLKSEIEAAIMIQRMLMRAQEIHDNHLVVENLAAPDGCLCAVIKSYAVFDYLQAILSAEENGYEIISDVLCAADYGVPQRRMRFVVMGVRKSIAHEISFPEGEFSANSYRTVKDAIGDLENIEPFTDLEDEKGIPLETLASPNSLISVLRDSPELRNHIVTKTTEVAMNRFKVLEQGQNFHALSEELKTNTYTDVNRTQNTIYLRLNYAEPSGTVVNVRKSMWIHPVKNRAVSIREAARLQTFPDSFVFYGSKDKQYQQVGNAVPPMMANAIAKNLLSILDKGENSDGR